MLPSEVAATDIEGIVDVSANEEGSKKITKRASALVADILGYYTDTGGDDAYVITTGLSLTALTAGMKFSLKVTTGNTGACTVAVDSVAATAIKVINQAGSVIDPYDNAIPAGGTALLHYNGTYLILENPAYPQILSGAALPSFVAANHPAKTLFETIPVSDPKALYFSDGSTFHALTIPKTISKILYVSSNFVDAQYNNLGGYSTYALAEAAANAGDTIVFLDSVVIGDNTVGKSYLNIEGQGNPKYLSATSAWETGGTRIVGTFSVGTQVGLKIRRISFDGNGGNVDAFTSTGSTQVNNSEIHDCCFGNIGASHHLCLLQNGSGWKYSNLSFFKSGSGSHALALRCSDVIGHMANFENTAGNSSIIVKSDSSSGHARNVVLTGIRGKCTGLYQLSPILIQSAHADYVTENIVINDVIWGDGVVSGNGAIRVQQDAGICRNITFNNCLIQKNYTSGFLFDSGSNIMVNGGMAIDVAGNTTGYSYQNVGATDVFVVGKSISPDGGHQSGTFAVGSIIIET